MMTNNEIRHTIANMMNDWNVTSDDVRSAVTYVAGLRARLAEVRMLLNNKQVELVHRSRASQHLVAFSINARRNTVAIERLRNEIVELSAEQNELMTEAESL
jgi:hypothetical protein